MDSIIKVVRSALARVESWCIIIERKISLQTGELEMLSESIARLTALAENIKDAVTVEAEEADAKIAARDAALAASEAAKVALAEKVAALEAALAAAGGVGAVELADLKASIDVLEEAAKGISKIVLASNPTPVSDVVTGSVVGDPAPTPDSLPVVVPTGVTDGEPAADAIVEAAEEVKAEQ